MLKFFHVSLDMKSLLGNTMDDHPVRDFGSTGIRSRLGRRSQQTADRSSVPAGRTRERRAPDEARLIRSLARREKLTLSDYLRRRATGAGDTRCRCVVSQMS